MEISKMQESIPMMVKSQEYLTGAYGQSQAFMEKWAIVFIRYIENDDRQKAATLEMSKEEKRGGWLR